jgi:hypothetical protein
MKIPYESRITAAIVPWCSAAEKEAFVLILIKPAGGGHQVHSIVDWPLLSVVEHAGDE